MFCSCEHTLDEQHSAKPGREYLKGYFVECWVKNIVRNIGRFCMVVTGMCSACTNQIKKKVECVYMCACLDAGRCVTSQYKLFPGF